MATPMNSSAANRVRPTIGDGLVVLLVLASAALLLWMLRPMPATTMTVEIILDGTLVAEYPLEDVNTPILIPVEAPWPLTVEIEHSRVRIAHSDCISQDCVHTGWIDAPGEQIICLPNKLIISLTGQSDTHSDDFDAMVG